MKMKALCIGIALSLSGCAWLSGYDAKTDFACKAPDGVLCDSMTGIYANAMANNLPAQRIKHGEGGDNDLSQAKGSAVMTKPIYSGTPIRSAPRVLRLWLPPWEDSDGDLHDQSYVYLTIDSGKWLVEHNRRRIQDAYRPVRAPGSATTAPTQRQGEQGGQWSQASVPTSQTNAEQESIGVAQDRLSLEQTAELVKGILKPGNAIANGE